MSDTAEEMFVEAIQKAVRVELSWEDIEPAYNRLLEELEEGLRTHRFNGLALGSDDGEEATIIIEVPTKAEDVYVSGPELKLSDVLLGQWPDCDGSTEQLLKSVELSVVEARLKLAERKANKDA